MAAPICEVDGCDGVRHGQTRLCSAHRQRVARHGDVLAHVPLSSLPNLKAAAAEEVERLAFAPAPAEGHGLLWLV